MKWIVVTAILSFAGIVTAVLYLLCKAKDDDFD
jgi:hypothetical protein